MSKVDDVRAGIIAALYDGNSLCKSECVDIVELLIQAVRDEEYELHQVADCSYKSQKSACIGGKWDRCEGCPADGTRYCP